MCGHLWAENWTKNVNVYWTILSSNLKILEINRHKNNKNNNIDNTRLAILKILELNRHKNNNNNIDKTRLAIWMILLD